jgi:hypothetical protein
MLGPLEHWSLSSNPFAGLVYSDTTAPLRSRLSRATQELIVPFSKNLYNSSQAGMLRKQTLDALIAATLLCISADFALTPFDDTGLLSHRTRSTRPARTECDHDTALLHEPEHGCGVAEMVAPVVLVLAPDAAAPEYFHSAAIGLAEGEILQPVPLEAPVRTPTTPGRSRAPPVA